jgi:recombination protein RecA
VALSEGARALIAKINKTYGEGSAVVAAEMPQLPRFPSGSLSLDVMLGGGWPGNQWCEIIGPESSGKTTVVHKTIAANQQANADFTTLWVAAEGYDTEWAQTLGVDTSRVIPFFTNNMEDAYSTMLDAAESREIDAIVLDSYPALVANDEQAKEMDQATMAAGARVTGKFFRKAGAATRRSLVKEERPLLGLIINQWRDQIGGFAPNGMTPKITPGGKAKNYAYYVRLEVSRTEWIDEKRPGKGTARVGQVIKLKTLKNKAASPQQVATLRFFFADAPVLGFAQGEYDVATEMVSQALLHGVLLAAGGWIKYGEEKWQGKDKIAAAILEDLDLRDSLIADVLAAACHLPE